MTIYTDIIYRHISSIHCHLPSTTRIYAVSISTGQSCSHALPAGILIPARVVVALCSGGRLPTKVMRRHTFHRAACACVCVSVSVFVCLLGT